MKLLATFETWEEASNLLIFLQGKGIIAELETRQYVYGYIATKYQVSAVLDEQYDDAVALMENPDHIVKNPLDPEEFQQYVDDKDVKISALDQMLNVLLPIGLVAIALIVALAIAMERGR